MERELDTAQIKDWRSIITLIVFVLTNVIVLFPLEVPIYIPRIISNAVTHTLRKYRVIPRVRPTPQQGTATDPNAGNPRFLIKHLTLNFITAPLIADLFLLAILAIGRQEVHDGTIGADNISPLDIMIFFLSLAYIAISIDASGLIRYLAYKVLQWGRKNGGRLFFYLYSFFFLLTSFIGNDPVILSGTAFLAYMTRVASNIKDRKAWIHTQFAVANIGSAILVSSNPTNLVLAGAFNIKFIHYTANMVVPVAITAIVLFPFLLYIIFKGKDLVPDTIQMSDLPAELKQKKRVNPNIPRAKDKSEDLDEALGLDEQSRLLLLQEVLHPWSDMKSAAFGAVIMATTLIVLLALNAANEVHQVFWITLPAAAVMFSWDVTLGWLNRRETREIAEENLRNIQNANAELVNAGNEKSLAPKWDQAQGADAQHLAWSQVPSAEPLSPTRADDGVPNSPLERHLGPRQPSILVSEPGAIMDCKKRNSLGTPVSTFTAMTDQTSLTAVEHTSSDSEKCLEPDTPSDTRLFRQNEPEGPATLVSIVNEAIWWLRKTFPAAMTVLSHLPFALVPFALSMFVLVQALVTKGWVPVFAHGWDHWVRKTGTIGAIGGMGFLSVVLCNFAGTNIGTAILLSRVVQAWQQIHHTNGIPISDRTFWATVYSMALGVNYGAFSGAFSASLAGLLWRDILFRKKIKVRARDFARVNLPIIAIAMTVGCLVLVGEVYIFRDDSPYKP